MSHASRDHPKPESDTAREPIPHDDRASLSVHDLSARTNLTVQTIRYYQNLGLLPPPRRNGRQAHYGPSHLNRLHAISERRSEGWSLKAIAATLDHRNDASQAHMIDRRVGILQGTISLSELASRTGVPAAILESLRNEGLLRPCDPSRQLYSEADVRMAEIGLALLNSGFTLTQLVSVGRNLVAALDIFIGDAVDVFDSSIRKPNGESKDDRSHARATFERFDEIFALTVELVTLHLEKSLMSSSLQRLQATATSHEQTLLQERTTNARQELSSTAQGSTGETHE
jgi:DNA-binding transcriptional MerR regulator